MPRTTTLDEARLLIEVYATRSGQVVWTAADNGCDDRQVDESGRTLTLDSCFQVLSEFAASQRSHMSSSCEIAVLG